MNRRRRNSKRQTPIKSRNSVDLWDDGRLILRFPAHQAHTPLDLRVLGERRIVVGGG